MLQISYRFSANSQAFTDSVKWADAYGFALGFRFSLLPAAASQALRASSP